MSAPEQPQGVLLRYAGGKVYALPTADRHVWRVAGVEVHVDLVAEHTGTGEVIGLETADSLAGAAHSLRMAREAAEHARVALEMERAPKRPAKRAGKAKAKGRAKR